MSIDFSPEVLTNDLVEAGHIIPVGVQGIFGRGPVFEKVLRLFDDYVSRVAANDNAIGSARLRVHGRTRLSAVD